MSAAPTNPELTAAIVKGAIVEAVLLAAGVALFLKTDQIWWIVGAAALGSAVMLFFMAQAGAFNRK